MQVKTIEWDRQKLYDEIWTTPLRSVAKSYGLSDVGLAKICKKLQIPRPAVGYWRRKECGFKVHRPGLPVLKEVPKVITEIEIDPPPKPRSPGASIPLSPAPATTSLHAVVKQTAKTFAGGRTDQFGRVSVSDWRLPHLDLRVTPAGLDRALKFMDRLVKLLEANGMKAASPPVRDSTAIGIEAAGEHIKVILKEYVRRRQRGLTPQERRDHECYPTIYPQTFRWAYDSTNRFVFEIDDYYDAQRVWSDSKAHKIEHHVEQIVHGIRAAAVYAKRLRVEREAERRRSENTERLRLRERACAERLKEHVAEWEEAQRIRAYLAAVRLHAEGQDGGLDQDSAIFRSLAWGEQYVHVLEAEALDPGADWTDAEE